MKKICLLCSLFLCCLTLPSLAGITFNHPTVTNNSTITFTASGEGATNGYIVASSLSTYVITVAQLASDNPPPYGTGDGDFSDYFTVSGFSVVPYNCTTHTPTTISIIVHRLNIANIDFDISFHFQMKTSTTCGGAGGTATDTAPTATVLPYGEFGNSAIARNFTRSNCGAGYTGSTVFESIPINTYISTTSQIDADNQATTAAQNNANATGTCTFSFAVTNNSGNALSMTFSTPGQSNVNEIIAAHSGTTHFTLVTGVYTVTISPAGSPVNCTMTFNPVGQTYGPAPGHTFTNITIGSGGDTSFTAN